MDKIAKKRQKEQFIVEEMIRLYCENNHSHTSNKLCKECEELLEYAKLRSQKCPFMKEKTFCVNCKVHCYKPEKREKIRKVMRYSGPRMLFRHPLLALWHVITCKQEAIKLKKDKI